MNSAKSPSTDRPTDRPIDFFLFRIYFAAKHSFALLTADLLLLLLGSVSVIMGFWEIPSKRREERGREAAIPPSLCRKKRPLKAQPSGKNELGSPAARPRTRRRRRGWQSVRAHEREWEAEGKWREGFRGGGGGGECRVIAWIPARARPPPPSAVRYTI